MQSEPKWIRRFFLFEISHAGVRALQSLVQNQPIARDKKGRKISRKIKVFPGDFNREVTNILTDASITQKEATFCLLDQRTFECHWETLRKLAAFKKDPNSKIELLYFLGVGWLHRAFSGIRHEEKMVNWWGRPNWRELIKMRSFDIAELVRKRFKDELGYRHTAAYPIFDKKEGNKILYYMIHASDHEEAPALMVRAHHKAVRRMPTEVQSDLFDRTSHS